MTTQTKSRGFTIVELLIVIVVIAILAAITIVAYNGITRSANASAAKSNADSIRSYAGAYQASEDGNGIFPAISGSSLATTSVASLPAGITITGTTALSATNGKTTIGYARTTGNNGACIAYWNYAATSPAVEYLYVGDARTGGYSAGSYTCSTT